MTISAFSTDENLDNYTALRHLFTEARLSSITDERWFVKSVFTSPDVEVFTEYCNEKSGDTISCKSDIYIDGKYVRHVFVFTKAG
jgi:hypothetical protein